MENNRPHLLIVDDVLKNIQVVAGILRQQDYTISFAKDGRRAIELANNQPFDLILLDIMMPEMNGFEVCEILKQNKHTAEIPIIFLTAKTDIESIAKAFELGGIDYIMKPFNSAELLARVKTHIGLKQTEKELRAANALKDKIFSIIAHDLRGPIGNYKSIIDLILEQDNQSDAEQIRYLLKVLQDSIGSSYLLLENLLYWANNERNKLSFIAEKVNLQKCIRNTFNLLTSNATVKNIKLITTVGKECYVLADTNMLDLVIRNLVSNAIKFTPEQGIITIVSKQNSVSQTDNHPPFVQIDVSDTGVGILPENIDKIFTKNQHFTTYGTAAEKGTGLGLKLCQEFVERHGGKIWVSSVLGSGSTFSFTIPSVKN